MNTAAEVEALMARVPDHVLVVFDEAYYEFVDSSDYPDTLRYVREGRKNVLIMRTYSKIYGLAGIRLGYAIADADTLAPMLKIKEPFAVNLLAQVAGLAALEDEEYRQASVAANHAGRHLPLSRVRAAGGVLRQEPHQLRPGARRPAGRLGSSRSCWRGCHCPAVHRL